MSEKLKLEKGDIVLFPFPFTDLTSRKLRPSLVISSEMGEDILLCQITSKKVVSDEYSIELKKDETIKGSLDIDSYVRTNMLFTASKSLIIKKISEISIIKYEKVILKIIKLNFQTIKFLNKLF